MIDLRHLQSCAHTYKGPLTVPFSPALNATDGSQLPRHSHRRSHRSFAAPRPPQRLPPTSACSKRSPTQPVGARSSGAASSLARVRHSQRRLHTSPTRAAACCQVRPSTILIGAPTRQRCAAHASATEAAMAPSSRGGAIKRREKGCHVSELPLARHEIGLSSTPWCCRARQQSRRRAKRAGFTEGVDSMRRMPMALQCR